MTDKAEADLAEIWVYVAVEASEAAATRLVDKLYAACEPLRQLSRLGSRAGAIRGWPARVLFRELCASTTCTTMTP